MYRETKEKKMEEGELKGSVKMGTRGERAGLYGKGREWEVVAVGVKALYGTTKEKKAGGGITGVCKDGRRGVPEGLYRKVRERANATVRLKGLQWNSKEIYLRLMK